MEQAEKHIWSADDLEEQIRQTPAGGVCKLAPGQYDLRRRVQIRNVHNVTVDGSGAKIVTGFDSTSPDNPSVDAFLIADCSDLTLENFTVTPDSPVNMSMRIREIDLSAHALVLEAEGDYPLTGREQLITFNSVDEEGSVDWKLNYYHRHPEHEKITTWLQGEILCFTTYTGIPYTYLGDRRYYVPFPESADLSRCEIGLRVYARHSMYGPAVFVIRNSDRTVFRNVNLYGVPGMGIIVLPRCRDLTLEGFRIRKPQDYPAIVAGNCDGVHITGLTGKFRMVGCEFDGLGDDALNIHAIAGTVTDIRGDQLICHYCKKNPDDLLPAAWCRAGDRIRAYDPKNLQVAATFRVRDFSGSQLAVDSLEGQLEPGMMLQNTALAPDCLVEGCIIRNTKARGILLQTDRVEVKNNTFYGVAAAAIMAAPAFITWYEVGPVQQLHIHGNRITKCGVARNRPAILVTTNHDLDPGEIAHLHKNIRIENNEITNSVTGAIEIYGADGVTVAGNRFSCRPNEEMPPVVTGNCADVTSQ